MSVPSLPDHQSTPTEQAGPISVARGSESGAQDIVDLQVVISALWRGKWMILVMGLAFATLGMAYVKYFATPTYRAVSLLILETRQQELTDFDSIVAGIGGRLPDLNTEVQILNSRSMMGSVVDTLDLTNDPEFNPSLAEPSASTRAKTTVQTYILNRIATLRVTVFGQSDVVIPKVTDIVIHPFADASDTLLHEIAVARLMARVTIRNVPMTYVFSIVAETEGPEKSAQISDALAQAYIQSQIALKYEKTEQASLWLSERVTDLQIELQATEEELKVFASETDLISPEVLTALNRQFKEVRDREASTRIAAVAQTIELAALRLTLVSLGDNPQAIAEVISNTALTRVAAQSISVNDALFAARLNSVMSAKQQEIDRNESQAAALQISSSQLEIRIKDQSGDLVELQQLEREVAATGALYEYFLARLKETIVQQGIQQADSRVLSKAVVPRGAASPRRGLIRSFSFLLGTLLAAVLILLREARAKGFRTAQALEKFTGYKTMGQIPLIKRHRRGKLIKFLATETRSQVVEAVRNLRTSLLLSDIKNPPKVIMLTSSIPGEGKTTQSISLAHNLATLGHKVLLIEGDLRRNVFTLHFQDAGEHKGLLQAINTETPLGDLLYHNDDLGIDVLFGEDSKENAADIYQGTKFKSFIEKIRGEYDHIIIDTPPVLAVPDARLIGGYADAILYVVLWDDTTRDQVGMGLDQLESVNLNVTGLILSQIDGSKARRYGYGEKYTGAYGNGPYYSKSPS